MCLIFLYVNHQKAIKRKITKQNHKKKDKYALMKRFKHYRQLQVYMYAFV